MWMGCVQVSEYYERVGDKRALSHIALRRIEHLYFKTDTVYNAMRDHVITLQASLPCQDDNTSSVSRLL
jgi:hypothetical protein